MQYLWRKIQKSTMKIENKNKLYLLLRVLGYTLVATLIALMMCLVVDLSIYSIICLIGYPALFLGFFGGVLYLYRHEFS